ncbi:flagellar protein FlaG [Janthinobacterium agaricidamnosum]|uniref:FlaG family protein n=1 Tax=Janthinobacterium agaricidamnosum NBRC 102515 = DSM 9628 TaxID=1349767 RepID=W0V3I5_9BURK|nr:flagellar protein FlaG [Janthinobacterium agaricidamnosum]CDG81908.1 flaG family protein [Janthinobacterium agaricidamnosum NBRC 102515 = DSM 9628]
MTIDSIVSAPAARTFDRSAIAAEATQRTAAPVGRDPRAAAEPTPVELKQAVSDLNKSPQATAQGLVFSIDEDSKRTVVKVIDQSTKEVLRQIPTVEALQIAKSLESAQGAQSGFLIKQTA